MSIELIAGFESTRFSNAVLGEAPLDVMDVTGHKEKYHQDLRLVAEAGIGMVRYPVLWHMIQKDPDLRYPTAAALADDLDAFLAGCPVSARSTSFTCCSGRPVRRRYFSVSSSAGKKPMVAPYSGAMFAIVARSASGSPDKPVP